MSDEALSDYQIARKRGYRFSEEQWLKSLKGEPGERGMDGERGERGPRGLQGERGNGIASTRQVGDRLELLLDDGQRVIVDLPAGPQGKAGVNGRDGADGELPEAVPWTVKFVRGANRLTTDVRLISHGRPGWSGRVMRDQFGSIDEVNFTQESA